LIFSIFNIEKVYEIAGKVSEKVLIQVEGATCSGKSSFVLDVYTVLKPKGTSLTIIEEAARKVLEEKNNAFFEQLNAYPRNSRQWKKSKIELQQKVLSHQIASLKRFAENNEYTMALMDRGGASTAYHTIPFLSGKCKSLIEEICREIAKMSSKIILLSPLGFLDGDCLRYQKTLKEIEAEHQGIKHYLTRWKLDYLEIPTVKKAERTRIGIRYILDLPNNAET